ncbi:1-phosphofructokinase family hexose kinase [Cognatiyoonia sp. IB215182]|uniref:1-phosphofructokinase family hexose kinase n=1 Tax=Cognatiyoonia sp. IB215182 TaxID=3097353 RepID=UPI002A10D2F5|nr:1-phosphofructokinase family hexose kinase [Cognatiyoonia sp. IB215182]MDX8354955.1 1-phosphofructokinase family hexose kinase [Cognatiyoonia sp. IB215182]
MAKQADILTITLNPAVDLATHVAAVEAGPKLRCTTPRMDPGGGGVNVARAICKLGGSATALIACGGAMGDQLLNLLAAEDVPTLPVRVSGETRQSFAVTDDRDGAQYRFSVPGHPLTPTDAKLLATTIAEAAPQNGFVVISGSMAPGLPDDFLAQIVAAAAGSGAQVIIDTYGPPLTRLMAEPPEALALLRLDQREAAEAAGYPMTTVADNERFAADLVNRGVTRMVVTGRGAEGSVLVSADQRLFCRPPTVAIQSAIGAGDAFLGAMVLSLARREAPETALQWGTATASATVSTEGTALCDLQAATERFDKCQMQVL